MKNTALSKPMEHKTYEHGSLVRFQIDKSTLEELFQLEEKQIKEAFLSGHEATYPTCESDCGTNMWANESGEEYFNRVYPSTNKQ